MPAFGQQRERFDAALGSLPRQLGLLAGVAFILLVAAGRFWLEREFGVRTLT